MSDKNKISMEDRGWEHMSTILDVELPQKKGERKPILWLFLAGVLLLAFCFLMNEKENPSILQTDALIAQERNINQNSVAITAPANSTDKNILGTNSNADAIETQLSKTILNSTSTKQSLSEQTFSHEKINDPSQELNETEYFIPAKPIEIEESNPLNSIKRLEGVLVKSPLIANRLKAESKSTLKLNAEVILIHQKNVEEHINVNTRNIIIYPELITRKYTLKSANDSKVELNTPIVGLENEIIKPVEGIKNFYAFTGGQLGINSRGLGYQMGIGRKFGDKNFNFFVEAGYVHMNYISEETESKSVVFELTPIESSTGFEFSEFDKMAINRIVAQNQISNKTIINNMNSVFITSGINKSISNRFDLSLGLTYSKFLRIENKEVNYSTSSGSFQNELSRYNVSKTSLFDGGEFRKYEFSTRLGIGYMITSRLSLSANYTLGLTNLLAGEQNGLTNDINDLPTGEAYLNYTSSSIFRKNAELRINFSF